MNNPQLGKLERIYPISPIYLQQAAIVAILSFVFFLAMIVAFSVWKNVLYFLLATAFLIVQVFTLFGWFSSRKKVFEVYEKGFKFRKHAVLWSDVESLSFKRENRKARGEIKTKAGVSLILNETIADIDSLFQIIETKSAKLAKSEPPAVAGG